ncbi:hypothetical protein M2165_004566 [Variovorax sp. TBS-050B]|nr:hypothetical protein [Variovorax sp. TBS-050B]
MPKITAHTMLVMVSITVGKKRSEISVATGRRVRIEVPKSPCSMWVKKLANCCGSGLSRPSSARTMATVCSSASCPAARRAGSPGSMWTNRNTSTATMSSVGIRPSSRLRK